MLLLIHNIHYGGEICYYLYITKPVIGIDAVSTSTPCFVQCKAKKNYALLNPHSKWFPSKQEIFSEVKD